MCLNITTDLKRRRGVSPEIHFNEDSDIEEPPTSYRRPNPDEFEFPGFAQPITQMFSTVNDTPMTPDTDPRGREFTPYGSASGRMTAANFRTATGTDENNIKVTRTYAPRKRRRTYRRKGYYKRRRTGSYRSPRNAVVYPNIVGLGGYGLRKNYGRELGGMLGEGVQGLASALGFGGYAVKSNTLLDMVDLGQSPPAVKNSRNGEATIFQHREYVKDLYTPANPGGGATLPTPFSIETFNINPGNSNLFPFLGPIAQNFQTYEIRGMLIELKTLSSEYTTNMAMGSMFVATEYNTYKTPPTDKRSLENMEYAMSCKPSSSCLAPIECSPVNSVQTHLYVASENNYGQGDERFSDLGQVYIGTQGCPGWAQPVAEIWVTYEIALYKPILNMGLNSSQGAHFQLQQITNTFPFGTTRTAGEGSNPNITVSPTRIEFPNTTAKWYVSYSMIVGVGTSVTSDLPTLAVGNGASITSLFSGGSGNNLFSFSSDENNGGFKFMYNTIIVVNPIAGGSAKPFLNWGTDGTYPTGTSFGDIHIMPYSNLIKT